MMSHAMTGLSVLSDAVTLVPLALILTYVFWRGIDAIDFDFLTEIPKPVGEIGGGMGNALVGTLILCGLASLLSIPVGIMAGIYLAQSRGTWKADIVRFAADTLNGIPSIVIGVFCYAVAVAPFKQFSALAGGLALGIMMIPLITRTTEELIRMVPHTMMEGALALGATPGRAMFNVVLPAALPGIVTGVCLAVARVAGETAPLLFTAFNYAFWSTKLTGPIASLPVQIYNYSISPYEEWHRLAWAGALVLIVLVLICSLTARFATRRLERMTTGM
jgi:phosphate transport system permease protein